MLIDVDEERFSVAPRMQPNGRRVYDFTWITGPGPSPYGFTIGSTSTPSAQGVSLSPATLEEEARLFVRAFFAPDGIGPSDFPEFVASRRRRE